MKVLLIAYDNDSHISYFPMGLGYVYSCCIADRRAYGRNI